MTEHLPESTCEICGERLFAIHPDQRSHPSCVPSASVVPLHHTVDLKEVHRWLIALHGNSRGYVHICSKGVTPENDDWSGRTFLTDNLNDAVAYIRELDAKGQEGIYSRVTTLKAPLKTGKRGGANDSLCLPALWADLDIAGPGHASSEDKVPLPPDESAGKAIIAASGLPEPTVWVHSGGGLYPMWVLSQPHVIADDIDDIKALSSGWQKVIKHAASKLGWRYDTGVGDLSRVLRVPGTVNRKEGLSRGCRIYAASRDQRYTLEELYLALADALAELPPGPKTLTTNKEHVALHTDDVFSVGTRPGDDFSNNVDWAEILEPHGWQLSHERGDTRYWTRPGKNAGVSASTNHLGTDRLHVFSTEAGFDIDDGGTSFSKLMAYAVLNHGGDLTVAARALADEGYGTGREPFVTPTTEKPPVDAQPPQHSPPLPREFWEARPYLRYIRDFAWSRGESAEGVLGATLARAAANTDHRIKLPATVAAPCGLTLLVALSEKSGGGKTACSSIARKIIPRENIPEECDGVPPGSGEGLIELLYGTESEVNPVTGKQKDVRRQVHHNAYIYIDEGIILSQLASRSSGNIFWSVLRSAFSDQTLGQSNASQERRRVVEAGSYVYGMVMAIQPEKTAALFGEVAEGTPQRLLWMPVRTPRPSRTQRPAEPLKYDWPKVRPKFDVFQGEFSYLELDYHLRNLIIDRRHDRVFATEDNEMEAHRDLLCLKVAAILAILDGRMDVTYCGDPREYSKIHRCTRCDWGLAEEIMDLSRITREAADQNQKKERSRLNRDLGADAALRDIGKTEKTVEEYERILVKARRRITAKVRQHAEASSHQGGCRTECLRNSLNSRERGIAKRLADQLETNWVTDAARRAVYEGEIQEEDGKYAPV